MTATKNFKIGVNAILIRDHEVLLGKRLSPKGYGDWGVPGGHLNYRESMVAGVKRELREETGLEALKVEFFQLINDIRQEEHYVQVNFLVSKWKGELKVMEPTKCEKWEWFSLDELPKNFFYGHRDFLTAYKEGKSFID